jgi:type I restriction enzyme, S subunit
MANDWRPSNWGDEVTLEYGKAIRGYSQTHGKYRVFGSNGPIGWTSDALTQGPGVVLGRKGAYRGVEFCREPFWVIDTAYYVVPKTDLDMRWLYYAVKHYELGEVDDGSPIPSTTRAAVYMLELDVPPKHEQQAISRILGTLDDKIELNRKENETLEAMARTLFNAWFVDFEPLRAKIEGRWQRGQSLPGLPAHLYDLFPDRLVESELGEIPEGWEVKKIGDVITRLTVGKKYEQKTVTGEGRTPVLDQGKTGIIGYHNDEPGVIATVETPVAVFANHTCFMRLISFPFSAIQNVLPFIGNGISTIWIFYASIGKQPFIEYKGHWPDFVIHKISIPPKNLAKEYAKVAHGHLRLIWQNERESRTLAQLRDTLLPKLISGELRVPDAERIVGTAV